MPTPQQLHGWIIIDKPVGPGSTQVVGAVKRALREGGYAKVKVGHGGTLDPLASGVLPVALGEATKLAGRMLDADKIYRFTIAFGSETDGLDAEGAVVATSDHRPSLAALAAVLPRFTGPIEQVPPAYSALKVDGERAYDLAREGEALDLAARPLWVEKLELVARPDADTVELEMVCGKGGYVRSIARDLGRALGCLGHVLWLRRLWSGPFHAAEGISLEDLDALARRPELEEKLFPLELGLADLPEVRATAEGAVRLGHGNPGQVLTSGIDFGTEVWVSHEGRAIAVGRYMGGEVHPDRVFNRGEP